MSEYWWKATDMTRLREEYGLTFADVGLFHELMSRFMDDFRTDLRDDRRAAASRGDNLAEYGCSEQIRARFTEDSFAIVPMTVARSVAHSGGIRKVKTALDKLASAGILRYTDDSVFLDFGSQIPLDQVLKKLEDDRSKPSRQDRSTQKTASRNRSRPQGTTVGTTNGTKEAVPPVTSRATEVRVPLTEEPRTSFSNGASLGDAPGGAPSPAPENDSAPTIDSKAKPKLSRDAEWYIANGFPVPNEQGAMEW